METTETTNELHGYRVYASNYGRHTFCHVHGSTVTVYKGGQHIDLICTTTDFYGQPHTVRISLHDVTATELIRALAPHL